ncbi:apolipoprotein L3 isoform 1-T2 [Molossus nigricans]
MASDADELSPSESKAFLYAIEFLMDPRDTEKLQQLLNEETWGGLVAAVSLSRDEADELYADLSRLKRLMATEDRDMPSKDQLHREQFLSEFRQVQQKLEERIGMLYALADQVDKMHRDCTISKVVATSTNVVSGILTIVGLSLAPVTAGASLVLLGTGLGLGIAASVTHVSTSIVEHSKNVSAKATARRLVSGDMDSKKVVTEVLRFSTPHVASLAKKCVASLLALVSNVRALKLAKSNPVLAAQANLFMKTGVATTWSSEQLQKAFGGTALAMTKGARVFGVATAGLFLLLDAIYLVKESVHLHKGAKAQSAKDLREQARELESKLKNLSNIHKILQEELIP